MDPILGAVLWLLMGAGLKSAWNHARSQRTRSRGTHVKQAEKAKGSSLTPPQRRKAGRQHDIAWWAREVFHGFPVHRTGMHSGWLAHKTVLDQHRAEREEARTSHLDARASILKELPEHRRRQAEAQKAIDEAIAKREEATGKPVRGRKAVKETAGAIVLPFRGRDDAGKGQFVSEERQACPECGAQSLTRFSDGSERCTMCRYHRLPPSRRVDGKPETEADKRFFDQRESGYTGPLDQDGNIPDPSDPDMVWVLDALAKMRGEQAKGSQEAATGTASSTEGTSMAGDATYTQSVEMAKQIEAEAEAAITDIRWEQMEGHVDAIGALMRGDSATLSDAAEVADALKEQRKAMERTLETAQAFRSNLQRNHGGIKEAADDAGVPMAQAEFYED